jgi:hypothetical protein
MSAALRFALGVLAIAVAVPATARAQLQGDLGFHGALTFPQGELARDLGDAGVGLGFRGGIGLRAIPLRLGVQLDAAWLVFGHERSSTPLLESPDVTRHVDVLSYVLMAHAWLRAQPWHGDVRPFAQILVGFKHFATDVDVTLTNRAGESLVASERRASYAIAPSYGLGAGVDILVGRSRDRTAEGFLTFGLAVLWGADAEHPSTRSSQTARDGRVLPSARSSTDIIAAYVGLSMTFGNVTAKGHRGSAR